MSLDMMPRIRGRISFPDIRPKAHLIRIGGFLVYDICRSDRKIHKVASIQSEEWNNEGIRSYPETVLPEGIPKGNWNTAAKQGCAEKTFGISKRREK